MQVSVLTGWSVCGCLLQVRKAQGPEAGGQQSKADTEVSVVVRAVCATKLPTLTFQDVARFRGLIADIFQGRA
jgi:dynein heavy chain 2